MVDEILPYCKIIILAGINLPLSPSEITLLRVYVEHGGSILVLAEANGPINLYNEFTQHFGISVYADCVLRAIYHKYDHPKDCFIQNAILCPVLLETNLFHEETSATTTDDNNLNLLYANGCSLDIYKPALPLVGSGSTSYPVGRPLGAFYQNRHTRGKLIVFGSGHSFTDK